MSLYEFLDNIGALDDDISDAEIYETYLRQRLTMSATARHFRLDLQDVKDAISREIVRETFGKPVKKRVFRFAEVTP